MSKIEFKLSSYRLTKLSFALREGHLAQGSVDVSPTIKYSYAVIDDSVRFILHVEISDEKLPFLIDVAYEGLFEINQKISTIDPKELEKIAYIYFSALLVPFIREVIAETTRKAGLRPFIIPVINFIDIYENNIVKNGEKVF